MALRTFTGTIRVDGRGAVIQTGKRRLRLVPYPEVAPIGLQQKQWAGFLLFGYLKDREATVRGDPSDGRLYNAHNWQPSWKGLKKKGAAGDPKLAPEAHDRFSQEIAQFFGRETREIAVKLNDAGILTVSALYHRLKNYEPEVRAFAHYLDVPQSAIRKFLEARESDSRSRALVASPPRIPVARGVNMKGVARATRAPVKTRAPEAPPTFPATARTPDLPAKVDLKRSVTAVKDQAFRGTCVAHAACAVLESALIRKRTGTKRLNLSEQYLYWACKRIDDAPREEGTLIEYAMQVLRRGVTTKRIQVGPGVCLEKAWRYVSVADPDNESQGPPPPRALEPPRYSIVKAHELKAGSIKSLKSELADGRCVGLSVYTYHFWTDGYVWREGVISLPFGIKPDGAHAICLVGYQDKDDTHGDGYFIFKNSWGPKWGAGRRDPGYGSLPYRYVLTEAIEAWSVEA